MGFGFVSKMAVIIQEGDDLLFATDMATHSVSDGNEEIIKPSGQIQTYGMERSTCNLVPLIFRASLNVKMKTLR